MSYKSRQGRKTNVAALFSNQKPSGTGQQTSENVVYCLVGLFPNSKSIKSEQESFGSFFADKIICTILECTYAKLHKLFQNFHPTSMTTDFILLSNTWTLLK